MGKGDGALRSAVADGGELIVVVQQFGYVLPALVHRVPQGQRPVLFVALRFGDDLRHDPALQLVHGQPKIGIAGDQLRGVLPGLLQRQPDGLLHIGDAGVAGAALDVLAGSGAEEHLDLHGGVQGVHLRQRQVQSAAAVVDDQQGAAEIGALFVGAAVMVGEIGAGGCRFTDDADILRVNMSQSGADIPQDGAPVQLPLAHGGLGGPHLRHADHQVFHFFDAVVVEDLVDLLAEKLLGNGPGRVVAAVSALLQQLLIVLGQQHLEGGKGSGPGVGGQQMLPRVVTGEDGVVVIQAGNGRNCLRRALSGPAQIDVVRILVIGRKAGIGAPQVHAQIHG